MMPGTMNDLPYSSPYGAPTTPYPWYTPPGTTPGATTDAVPAWMSAIYQKYLGRPATAADVQARGGADRWVGQEAVFEKETAESNDAILYKYSQSQTPPGATPPPGGPIPPGGTTPPPPGTFAATGQGGTGSSAYQYAGFDFDQAGTNRDTGRSAKYAFADASRKAAEQGVPASAWATKAGAQDFAERYIKPALEAKGYKVLEIRGDKMRVLTREDTEAGRTNGTWIDFVINAGGANPQLGWQPEDTLDAYGTVDPYVPTPGAGTATAPPPAPPGTPGTTPPGAGPPTANSPTQSPGGMSGFVYDPLAPTMADLPSGLRYR